jgi:hypothetical protein
VGRSGSIAATRESKRRGEGGVDPRVESSEAANALCTVYRTVWSLLLSPPPPPPCSHTGYVKNGFPPWLEQLTSLHNNFVSIVSVCGQLGGIWLDLLHTKYLQDGNLSRRYLVDQSSMHGCLEHVGVEGGLS